MHAALKLLDKALELGRQELAHLTAGDVDTAEDLVAYARRNRDWDTHTMALIRHLNLAPAAWNS